jgi:hypothetical protein
MSFRPMRLNSKSESTFDTKEHLSAELNSSCTAAISDFACLEKGIITNSVSTCFKAKQQLSIWALSIPQDSSKYARHGTRGDTPLIQLGETIKERLFENHRGRDNLNNTRISIR